MVAVGCSSTGADKAAVSSANTKATVSKQAKGPSSFANSIGTYASVEERLARMSTIAEDGSVSLLFDETTGDVALLKDGFTYISTPWDLAGDQKLTDAQKSTVASQIRLTFMDNQKSISEISSFSECISKGQYTIQKIQNGVQVNMIIGRAQQRTLVPPAMPDDSFDKVISELDGRPVSRMKAFYKLYDPETTPENQLEIIREKYPVVDNEAIRVLKEITDKERNELEEYFVAAGYTFEDMEKDLESMNATETETVKPRFEISVQYTLENGALCVRIPSNLISYDTKNFSLLEIGALEYMASARVTDGGYLFLPDGSGTIVGFNSGEKIGNDIKLPVYGYDRSVSYLAGYDRLMTASLPVYGIKSQSGTMLVVIGEGAATADIVASSGGSSSMYARVGTVFSFADYDTFEYKDVNTQYSWSIVDSNTFGGTFELEFIPLDFDAGYAQMAAAYRDRIKFSKTEIKNALPLTVGLLGSVKHQDQMLFMPVTRQVPLTKFEDAITISKELQKNGVDNLSLRLIGWEKGGLDTGVFTSFSPDGTLGGKKNIRKLNDFAKDNNIGVYPDADFTFVKKNSPLDKFYAVGDTARMLDKTYAGYNRTRLSSGLMESKAFMYALKPTSAKKFFDSFISSYKKSEMGGLSLGTLGGNLNSDKSQKGGADRESSLLNVQYMLKTASKNLSVMTEGANAYTFAYVNQIVSAPLSDSGYPDADYSVPFLQMVLHGKIPYTTPAINLSGDFHTEVLKAVENGSGLYYELAYRNTDLLKTSEYADIYSADYKTWKEQLLDSYSQVNSAIGNLQKDLIVGHEHLESDFVKVTYSSGAVVYVNYSDTDKSDAGYTVPARSFKRV